jgi:hypothetical protein
MGMETHPEIIRAGSQVELILRDRDGNQERLSLVIVPPEAADYSKGYLGQNTPLAQALIGESVGTIIPYLKDDIYSIEIVSVSTAAAPPPEGAERRRQAALKKALRELQDTNARLFASSFSGKWGDYDPDSLPKEETPDDSG